ncbi:kinase-like domain-containing protein [Nemania abortiva]|nr:kinase-like domain-containing protein [Nemania abortiva]
MASLPTTELHATVIPKPSIIHPTGPDNLRNISNVIVPKLRIALGRRDLHPGGAIDIRGVDLVEHVSLLAVGGYNSIWLVKLHQRIDNDDEGNPMSTSSLPINRFVLRLPCEDALVPYQVTNEVAFRRFVASKLPQIPVPRVFLFEATDHYDSCFIAEDFIDGTNLSSEWMSLSLAQKEKFARKLATITVDLAEVQFGMIGGLDAVSFSPAPTVEGPKLFKGRHKFHRPEHYHIGPYHSTKEYILACYDREIYYYSYASADIDSSLFEETSVQAFIDQLREKRQALAVGDMDDEPFVLVHGDLHGRNILVRGDQIVAVLDWEFAGSYPLSETLSGGDIDVVEAYNEDLDEENTVWGRKVRSYIRQEVEARAWSCDRIDMLLGNGNQELGRARTEMFP